MYPCPISLPPQASFPSARTSTGRTGARTLDPMTFDPPSHAHVCADCPGARRTPHLHTGAHCFGAISGAAERRRSCVFASSPERNSTSAASCAHAHARSATPASQGKLTGGSGCRRNLATTIQRDYLHGAPKPLRLARTCVFSTRESKPPARR